MLLVNQTQQTLNWGISAPGAGDCGTIDPCGIVDLPSYDNLKDVTVSFTPVGTPALELQIAQTQKDQLVNVVMRYS